MTTGGDDRRVALAAALAVLAAAGWMLVWAAAPRHEPSAYTIDVETGEVWACAGGVCQTND